MKRTKQGLEQSQEQEKEQNNVKNKNDNNNRYKNMKKTELLITHTSQLTILYNAYSIHACKNKTIPRLSSDILETTSFTVWSEALRDTDPSTPKYKRKSLIASNH